MAATTLADMTGQQTRVRAYRFTLDPTPGQLEVLVQHAGAARWAYNYALAAKEEAWSRRQLAIDELVTVGYRSGEARTMVDAKTPTYVDVAAAWRAERDVASDPRRSCSWHTAVSSYAFSSAFRAADAAYKAWFDSMAGKRPGRPVGRPRFKRKGRARDSFSIYHDVKRPTIRVESYRRIVIPRLGSVRIHDTARPLAKRLRAGTAVVKSVTVSRGAHRWYASLLVEESVKPARASRAQQAAGTVGVDVGVAQLAALSTGELVGNQRRARAAQRRLTKASQAYARTQRGSGRRAKAAARMARVHHQAQVARRGDLHQLTARLAAGWETVVVEDLNLAGMTRRPSPVPDPDHPGGFLPNGAAAKIGLNRSLADSALGELRRQLEYKTGWCGSRLVAVDPAYTSQTCSECGHVARENRKSQAVFSCVECGHTLNADVNAARIIRVRGIIMLAAERVESINARGGGGEPRLVDVDEAGRLVPRAPATGPGVIPASPPAA